MRRTARRPAGAGLAGAALALALAAPPAAAYFEEVAIDARAIGMGATGASVADVAAVYWNAAALAEITQAQVLLDYGRPYGVPSLNANAVALAWRVLGSGAAAAWHRTGISDVYAEDRFTLAAARGIELPDGHRLQAGAAVTYGRVSVQPYRDESGIVVDWGAQGRASFDLGLRWVTPWKLTASWSGRDLNRPRYELVAGSGGARVASHRQLALAYRWHRESTLSAGWTRVSDLDRSTLDLGLEVWFYGVFALRSGFTNTLSIPDAMVSGGLSNFDYTGGFGIRHRGLELDAAALTDRSFGASYRASLKARLPWRGTP